MLPYIKVTVCNQHQLLLWNRIQAFCMQSHSELIPPEAFSLSLVLSGHTTDLVCIHAIRNVCTCYTYVCVRQVCNLLDIAQGEVEAMKHKTAVTSCSFKAVRDTCAISSATAPSLHQVR